MNKFYLQIITGLIILLSINIAFAQHPTFKYTVRNIKTANALGKETGDTLTFEVWLRWTNYGASDRFEFAAAQYTWTCTNAIVNGSGLVLDLLPGGVNNPLPSAYRPWGFQVDSLTAPQGQVYLKAGGNNPNSALPPFIVSANAPFGSKLLTFRLRTINGSDFPIVPLNLRFKLGAAPNTFVAYFLPVTVPDTEAAPPQLAVALMDTVVNNYTVENPDFLMGLKIKVNLTALFEGRYDNTLNNMSKRDTISVYLRNAAAPFNIADSARGVIDSANFSNVFSFLQAPTGNYYIVIKHKQCIETWSKSGGEYLPKDGSVINYDFTSASSQAYFDNMILKGSKYCLYGGDVDQNGFINLTDVLSIYNDSYNFVIGNVSNDLTGDGIVDLHDMLIAGTNKNSFIRVRTP